MSAEHLFVEAFQANNDFVLRYLGNASLRTATPGYFVEALRANLRTYLSNIFVR